MKRNILLALAFTFLFSTFTLPSYAAENIKQNYSSIDQPRKKTVKVKGYTKKNGTKVKSYKRRPPKRK